MGNKNQYTRAIYFYKHYYLEFYEKLRPEVKKKFNWTLQLISTLDHIPEKYFKHLTETDGIYEIRVEAGTNQFRVFCFFDKGQLIVLTNGFQKKTQKTPLREIERAEKLKKQYFNEKSH